MVWRESSWAAHYQSPLPASDTLFTVALGPDSPGRRQQTQGTALPSPYPLALVLLGLANSWALTGFTVCWTSLNGPYLEGTGPTTPLYPLHPKVQRSEKGPLMSSPVPSLAPEALGLGRGTLGPGASLQSLTYPWCKRQAGDTGTLRASSLPPSHLADSIPIPQGGEVVSDPGVGMVKEWLAPIS